MNTNQVLTRNVKIKGNDIVITLTPTESLTGLIWVATNNYGEPRNVRMAGYSAAEALRKEKKELETMFT